MNITLPFKNNILPKRFCKDAKITDLLNNNPVRSFPFEISNLPEGTKCIALSFIDYDAIPVCGFPWIHWLLTDLETINNSTSIPENFSLNNKNSIIQGKNSFASPLLESDYSIIDTIFVGPTPPDKDHRYTLEVFALSNKTTLKNGFYYNELLDAVSPILLDKASVMIIGQK